MVVLILAWELQAVSGCGDDIKRSLPHPKGMMNDLIEGKVDKVLVSGFVEVELIELSL